MQAMAACPSFSTHSSGARADIAARVVEELRNEPHPDTANLFHWAESSVLPSRNAERPLVGDGVNEVADEEEDFEFAFVTSLSPISADEIFSNGQIKPVYPVFNRDLLIGSAGVHVGVKIDGEGANPKPKRTGRVPLRKLMTEERETTTSCSSSEADDLESVPSGTYCVWAPPKKLPEPDGGGGASGRKCKKSNSTGSSKRWKLRDLLHRSNSEGKDRFVFISPSGKKSSGELKTEKTNGKEDGGGDAASAKFSKSKTVKEGGKRKAYLGYKHDLVGLLANVNGLSRNLRPF